MELSATDRAVLLDHRHTTWRVLLLTEHDRVVRELGEYLGGGNLEQDGDAEIRGGGSLPLVSDRGFEHIDWGRARLQVLQQIDGLAPIPWGVYLVERPDTTWHDELGTAHTTVTLLDKLAVPAQAQPAHTYSLPAGANIVAAVVAILRDLGETRITATDSGLTLPTGRVFPVDDSTSWLGIINDLLTVINYEPLWTDRDGVYQIGPHREATITSPPAWSFAYGQGSLYMPEWSTTEDWYQVPNQVVLVGQGDEQTAALVATVTNTDRHNQFSVPRRGRVITVKETGVEASSLAVLQALAGRRLQALTAAASSMSITTAPLPLWPGDRVDLVTPSRPAPVRAVVSSWSIDLEHDGLMDHQWREVATLDAQ